MAEHSQAGIENVAESSEGRRHDAPVCVVSYLFIYSCVNLFIPFVTV